MKNSIPILNKEIIPSHFTRSPVRYPTVIAPDKCTNQYERNLLDTRQIYDIYGTTHDHNKTELIHSLTDSSKSSDRHNKLLTPVDFSDFEIKSIKIKENDSSTGVNLVTETSVERKVVKKKKVKPAKRNAVDQMFIKEETKPFSRLSSNLV